MISSDSNLYRRLCGYVYLALTAAFVASLSMSLAEAAGDKPAQEPDTTVLVTSAAQACFSKVLKVTGFLQPKTPAILTLDLDGFQVAEVFASEGDRVNINQPLVRIARIAPESSQMGQQGQGQQGQGLGAPSGVGQSSFLLHAPAGGTIIKSRAEIGAVASPAGDPLFQIAADNIIEVSAEIPGLYISEIAEGQSAVITTEQGQVSGRVRLVGGEIDPVSHMGHVRLSASPDVPLRAGGFVKASIDTSRSCGVSVPLSSVSHSSDGVSVQIVRGHIIETHRVRLGLHSDHEVEIKEGVRIGDLIVAHAGTSLRDGDEVVPRQIEDQDQTGTR